MSKNGLISDSWAPPGSSTVYNCHHLFSLALGQEDNEPIMQSQEPSTLCFSHRPTPTPFYTVTFSHQKFRVYWAFQSRGGSSSLWWKPISHFHRASRLSDSIRFCFILHFISSHHRHVALGRRHGERWAEGIKRTLEHAQPGQPPFVEEVRREGLSYWVPL